MVCKCGEWQGSLDEWEVSVCVCVYSTCIYVLVCMSVCMYVHNAFMATVYKFYVIVYIPHCHVHSLQWGSHLDIPCWSICDRNQNWSRPFFQGIKVTSKLQESRTFSCSLTFEPLKIRSSRVSEVNSQVIKHTFCQIKNLEPSRQHFSRQTYKWIPLEKRSWARAIKT